MLQNVWRFVYWSGAFQRTLMKNAHQLIGKHGNPTTLRTLYYPPITEDTQLKPGQIRLGEHSDYGTINSAISRHCWWSWGSNPGGRGTCLQRLSQAPFLVKYRRFDAEMDFWFFALRRNIGFLYQRRIFGNEKCRQSIVFFCSSWRRILSWSVWTDRTSMNRYQVWIIWTTDSALHIKKLFHTKVQICPRRFDIAQTCLCICSDFKGVFFFFDEKREEDIFLIFAQNIDCLQCKKCL